MKNNGSANSGKKFNSLLTRIADCERGALEEFYSCYGKLIYAAALTVVTPIVADEVVNDVLAKIWLNANKIKVKSPVSWLYSVSVNCAKDKLRAERAEAEIFDSGTEDCNIEDIFAQDSFYSYIKFLDEEEQKIIVYRFVQDMSFKEISKAMGKPLNTVTSVYYRALKKIKEKIEKMQKNG
ncbi:MAG: sigma-70 family RNA polymerase sigma factor [Clostridia bacterium]|nr:sigma-70 family RNA polymerase sigma factor [Clostridia bacterium]